MKPMHINEDIIAIGEFKTHAARILRKLKETHRPIVVTQHGKPAAVIVSPDDFDSFYQRTQFENAVKQGLADVEQGRFIEDQEMKLELDSVFGTEETP